MSTCPNINTPEWKALVNKVGKFEAYRDYMETEGLIRKPEEVKAKLDEREAVDKVTNERDDNYKLFDMAFNPNPSLADIVQSEFVNPGIGISAQQVKNTRAIELADKVSRALGVNYEFLTPDEAANLTAKSKNPWSGQAAFFFGGKVYFLQDRISSENVLHEFAHPFIRAISKENPELFDTLYAQLASTPEGVQIIQEIKDNYTELEFQTDLFKEEVIVKALEKAGMQKIDNEKTKGAFGKWLNEMLYAIKQFLRKHFGRAIKVSKLSPNTSLNELANIITEGKKVEISTELISDEEIVAYNKEAYEEVSADLETVKTKEIQNEIDTLYDMITGHIKELQFNENYEELAEIFKDQYKRSDYHEMKSNLAAHKTGLKEQAEKFVDEVTEAKNKVESLTNTLFRLENILSKMHDHVEDIAKRSDTQENMHKAYYYSKFVKHYEQFIKQIDKGLRANKISSNSPVRSMVSGMKSNIDDIKDIVGKMQGDGARDALYEQLEPLHRNISERYEQMIKDLKDRGAPQWKIDATFKEYHGMNEEQHKRFGVLMKAEKEDTISVKDNIELNKLAALSQKGLSITKEKIEKLLKGQMGDANWFNSYLEGYLYNTDPIVGGLALYVKNALNEVMIVSQQKYSDFADDMKEDLEAAGYNPRKVSRLGEQTTFRDKVGRVNPDTGVLEEVEVNTFLNKFKDYRYEAAVYKTAVDTALSQYQMSGSDSNKKVLVNAVAAQKQFLREYMHQEYVPEFYERSELFENDDIGKEAAYRRDGLFERMRKETEPNKSQLDQISGQDAIDLLWREYKQMHSRYDLDGNLKTGEEAAIAKRLRTYRDQSREFYEFKIKKGVFENRYFDFQQELRNEGIDESSDDWVQRMNQWKKVNSRAVIKPEFYERRNEIIEEIKEIMSKLPDTARNEIDQSAVWEDIIDLTGGYRDENGQPNASEMSEGEVDKVRDLQLKLEEIREQGIMRSGLTRAESQELNDLYVVQKSGGRVDYVRMRELQDKKNTQGLNSWDITTLDSLYAELAELSTKDATEYYVDITNNWMGKLDISKHPELNGMDKVSVNFLLDPNIVDSLFDQSPEFEKWFTTNHILKEYYNKETKQMETKYERLYVWSVVKPTDSSMMESYDIKDSAGNVVDTVAGLPSMNFYNRVVKTKYRTRNIPGVTKDNQGNFLPKTLEDGAKDDKFINEDYEKMRTENPALFKVLEKLKKHHLKNQEGLAYRSKLYLDIPRYRKGNLEILETIKLRKKEGEEGRDNTLTILAKRVKDFIRGAADDAEDGYSYQEKFNLVRADMFDNEMTDIPISGLYNIEADDTSMDVTLSMMRYMLSAERQKQLVNISPMVRAVQATVNNQDNAIDDINKVNKNNFQNNVLKFLKKDDKKNVRKKAINNFIEREFEGQKQTGLGADVPWLNNFANLLFKRASFSFFAMNIPSALKNSLGMKFQEMIEASAGKHVDHTNLQKGNVWSYATMGELSTSGLHRKGSKTHRQQTVDMWDMVQGRFEEKFGTEMSRSAGKDAADMSWLYSPRKWVEIQAGIQLSAGMLYKKKLTQTLEDGTKKEVSYIDAFETIDGQIKLKEGIDVRYSNESTHHTIQAGETVDSIAKKYNTTTEAIEKALGGKALEEKLEKAEDIEDGREEELSEINLDAAEDAAERTKLMDKIDYINAKYDKKLEKNKIKINNSEFKFMKNKMHQVQNNMGGAYAKFDQPEAQRYVAFRFISYMRRYFTTMAMNRWGFSGPLLDPKPRLNPGMGDVQMGFYVQFVKTMIQTVKTMGGNLKYLTAAEKAASIKFFVEVGMLMTTSMLMGLLFGWDPDDDEKYARLRAKSGPMGFFGLTADDPDREFDMLGYAEVHALHLLMQVRAENEQFNLLTGGIKQYNSLLDIKSVALGPTTDSYVQIWDDMSKLVTGHEKGYYSRKVGPYGWQQKEEAKIYNHFFKTFGLSGTSLDPALAIQNFQAYQSKVRR